MKKNRRFWKCRLGSAVTTVLLLMGASWAQASSAQSQSLPALGANIDNTSVSGLSSGAFMTSQFFMAHSANMVGAGIVAGGPYLCAQSYPGPRLTNAMTACMNPLTADVGPNTPLLIKKTNQLASDHQIDPVSDVTKARLYLFSGTEDHTVSTIVMDQTYAFFKKLGVPDDQINYVKKVAAGHAFITENNQDNACGVTKPPYINDCDIPQAEDILAQIYPSFKAAPVNEQAKAMPFNQKEFIKDQPFTSMDDTGYVYIPAQCQKGTACSVHVVFHGCEQGATVKGVGDQYYDGTGYNAFADANNLIMLYPQVHPSEKLTSTEPYNPKGCWDFWGYSIPSNPTSGDYFSANAPQIKAVYSMVQRLAGNRE